MRDQRILSALLTGFLSLSGTAWAKTNSTPVPTPHWTYDPNQTILDPAYPADGALHVLRPSPAPAPASAPPPETPKPAAPPASRGTSQEGVLTNPQAPYSAHPGSGLQDSLDPIVDPDSVPKEITFEPHPGGAKKKAAPSHRPGQP